jgi:DNA-binding NtrC family response regulator
VRELRNLIEAAALLGDGDVIELEDLGLDLEPAPAAAAPAATPAPSFDLGLDLEGELWRLISDRGLSLAQATQACEEMMVRAALRAEGDNRTRAAARLGINVRTIYKKMTPGTP